MEAKVKKVGIPIGKATVKDGKLVLSTAYKQVSERIRISKSKRVRPAKGPKL